MLFFSVFTKAKIRTTLIWKNRWDHSSNTGSRDALSSLGLMPSVRYFTWLLASPISYIQLHTKQTQTIQYKAQEKRLSYEQYFLAPDVHRFSLPLYLGRSIGKYNTVSSDRSDRCEILIEHRELDSRMHQITRLCKTKRNRPSHKK